MTRPWTEDEDAALRTAAHAGQSSALVAARLGRSRNSCIGRANRIGVSFQRAPRDPGLVTGPKHDADKLGAFADALADHGTVTAAAAKIGVSHQRGSQMFARIKGEIDKAQRAAGFAEWCR